jgi:magnesium transporter
MITRHARGKVTWIDLQSPSREELSDVMAEFGIDARIEEEASHKTPYPIVVSSLHYLYLILHFPTAEPGGGTKTQEIDFIVGKKFLITVQHDMIRSLHNLHKAIETEELIGIQHKSVTADALIERVLRHLYGSLREEVEIIGRRLDNIETDIFGGKERKTMRTISDVNRVLLRFDMTLGRHAESLTSLLSELTLPTFFGKSFMLRAAHIDAEREHVATLVASYREIAAELRDTNDSLLSASQNEVMKTLTVITFTILPVTLISSLFQMNFADMPLLHNPHAFWIVVSGMALVMAVMVTFARRRKWL